MAVSSASSDLLFGLGGGIAGQQHLHRVIEERDGRNGQQGADDPGKHTAGGDRQHHPERVNGDRAPHHQRLQQMRLDLIDHDQQAEREQRVDDPLGQQCDHHGHQPRDQGTDQRDEGTEKHQRRQRQRQRDAHDGQPGTDTGRVGEGHQKGSPHIGDQRPVSGTAGFHNPVAHVDREDLGHVLPDVAAAVEEENQGEQHQHRGREHFGEGGRGGQRPAGQLRLIVVQRLDRGIARVGDLLTAQMRRPFDQPPAACCRCCG